MNDDQRAQAETAAQNFAAEVDLPYYDTRPHIDIEPLIGKLTLEGMQAYGVVPLSLQDNKLSLGINETTRRELLEPLRARLNGYNVSFNFISSFGWMRLFNRYHIAENRHLLDTGDFSTLSDKIGNLEPKLMFEPLAQVAYQLGASDIHIEPASTNARVRFRIDGTLHPIITLSKDRYDLFTSDLQMRASVKWGADTPQSGRINTRVVNDDGDEVELNMRLETVPSLHGQDVVIRLFNLSTEYMSVQKLNLKPNEEKSLLKAVSHPSGMVLTVGPTGSGKTSTLYSIINHLNSPEVKIVTLEDPIEYELDGISQVPVNTADQQSFSEKLRAVLREDPNIIMIGEIRDADTAKTALQAALTGHLVLSTFHASSSSAAVSRLMDMMGQNPLLASAVSLIMAQRLVRKLCDACKKEEKATKEEILEIKTALQDLPADQQPDYDKIKLQRSVGCDQCHHFGFRGRLPLTEQLIVDTKMEELIANGTSATTAQAIEQAAMKNGMTTLLQDGVQKAIAGLTTLEEVYAAVGE